MKKYIIAAAALIAGSANAAIVVGNATTAAVPGGTRYTYRFDLQADQNMRQTCAGTCSLANDYVVLFDFAGYINGTSVLTVLNGGAANFTLTQENTSTQAPFQAIPDNAALPNFRVSRTGGGTINGAPAGVELFTLALDSTLSPGVNNIFYSAQAQNAANTNTAGNSNFSAGPTTAAIPEPSTFVLLGAGLAGLALRRRK